MFRSRELQKEKRDNLVGAHEHVRLQMTEKYVDDLSRESFPFVYFAANTVKDDRQQLQGLGEMADVERDTRER